MSDDIEIDYEGDPFGGLDLDDGDFGSQSPKVDRNPVVESATTFAEAYKSNVTNNQRNIQAIREVLPDGYSRTLDVADEMKEGLGSIYRDATKEVSGPLRDLAVTTRRLTPRLRSLLPNSAVDRVEGWLDKKIESGDGGSSRAPTQEEVDNQVITSRTQEIFAKQLGLQAEQAQEQRVQKVIDDQVNTKRHKETRNVQLQMLQIMSDERDYRNSVLWRYQKESLELNYRQFFAQRDLLENFKQFASMAQETLQGIQKNTGLPDAQKIELSEQYREYTQEMLFGKAHEAINNKLGGIGQRILSRLGVKINETAQSFASGISDISGIGEMMADQMDAEEEMGGSGKINPLKMGLENRANWLGKRTREFVGEHVDKYLRENEKANLWNEKLLDATSNAEQYMQMMRDGETNDADVWWQRGLRSFFDWIELDDARDHDTSVLNNLQQDATKAMHWGLLERRSLVEIIPGYLARQLQQLKIIAGDPDAGMEIYSTQREAFIDQRLAVNDTRDKVMKDDKIDALADTLTMFIERVDPDNLLTQNAQRVLGKEALKDLRKGHTFNPQRFFRDETYEANVAPEHVEEIKALLSKQYGLDEYTGEMTKESPEVLKAIRFARASLGNARQSLLDYQTGINLFSSTGDKELLRLAGFLKNKSDGDHFIEQNQDAATDRALARMLDRRTDDWVKAKGYSAGDFGPQPDAEMRAALARARHDERLKHTTDFVRPEVSDAQRSEGSTSTVSFAGFPKVFPLPNNQLQSIVGAFTGKLKPDEVKGADRDLLKHIVAIRENTDVLPNLTVTAEGGQPGLASGAMRRIGSGLWSGIESYGRGIRNAGQFGLDTLAGGRNAVMSWFTRSGGLEQSKDEQDLYLGSGWFPKLRVAKLKAGEYFDAATGEVISSWDDIKGAVKDKDGNIVLTDAESKMEFITSQGTYILKGAKALATAPFKAAALYANAVTQLPMTILKGISGGWQGLKDRVNMRKDVYNADGKVVLYYHRMRAGEYFNKEDGKVLRSIEDITGEVVDLEGNVVLTMADLDGGLVDRNGKPISTFNLANLALGAMRRAGDIGGTVFRTTKRIATDLYSGATTAVKDMWGRFFKEDVSEKGSFGKVSVKNMHVKAANVYINGKVFSTGGVGAGIDLGDTFAKAGEKVSSASEKVKTQFDDVKTKFTDRGASAKASLKRWIVEHTDFTEEEVENFSDEDLRDFVDKHWANAQRTVDESSKPYRDELNRLKKEFKDGDRTVASTASDAIANAKDNSKGLKRKLDARKDDAMAKFKEAMETIHAQGTYKDGDKEVNVFDQLRSRFSKSPHFDFSRLPDGEDAENLDPIAAMLLAIDDAYYQSRLERAVAEGKDEATLQEELIDEYKDAMSAQSTTAAEELETMKNVDKTLTERLGSIASILEERFKPVFGDTDGDGIREGSHQDIKERAAEARKRARERFEKKRDAARNKGKGQNADGANGAALGGALGLLGAIKDVLTGGFATLAALWAGKKGVEAVIPDGVDIPGGDGDGKKGKGGKPTGKKGLFRRMAGGLGKFAMRALRFGGGALWSTARFVGSAALSVLGTTAGAVVVGAAVTGAAAYYGGKYMWRRSKPEALELLRFNQYGFENPDERALVTIRYFESELMEHVSYDSSGVSNLKLSDAQAFEQFHEEFGLEMNQEDYLQWRIWFLQRFVPVFTTNLTHARRLSNGKSDARSMLTFGNLDLQDIDDEMDDEFKAEFVRKTVYNPATVKGGPLPYAVMVCPFKPLMSMSTYASVRAMADDLIKRYDPSEEDIKKTEAAKAKLAAAALKANAVASKPNTKLGEQGADAVMKADKAKANAYAAMSKGNTNKFIAGGSAVTTALLAKQTLTADAQKAPVLTETEKHIDAYVNRKMQENSVNVIGEDTGPAKATGLGDFILPTYGTLTSPFGQRVHPTRNTVHNHSGVDIAAPTGTEVYAAQAGQVTRCSYSRSYGNVIYINHANGMQTRYAHLSGFAPGIMVGTQVSQGQLIGYVGSTGVSTGPHLHFQLKKGQLQSSPNIDPFSLMGSVGKDLNKRGLELTKRTLNPTQGESASDIDAAIEGIATIGDKRKSPVGIPLPPQKESVYDSSTRGAPVTADGSSLDIAANRETVTPNIHNNVDVTPIGDEVSRITDSNDAMARELSLMTRTLKEYLDEDKKRKEADAVRQDEIAKMAYQANAKANVTTPATQANQVAKKEYPNTVFPSVINQS